MLGEAAAHTQVVLDAQTGVTMTTMHAQMIPAVEAMTLRDVFAAVCLNAFAGNAQIEDDVIVQRSYALADMMLRERARQSEMRAVS